MKYSISGNRGEHIAPRQAVSQPPASLRRSQLRNEAFVISSLFPAHRSCRVETGSPLVLDEGSLRECKPLQARIHQCPHPQCPRGELHCRQHAQAALEVRARGPGSGGSRRTGSGGDRSGGGRSCGSGESPGESGRSTGESGASTHAATCGLVHSRTLFATAPGLTHAHTAPGFVKPTAVADPIAAASEPSSEPTAEPTAAEPAHERGGDAGCKRAGGTRG
mmetsp:Transcript_24635/g.56964  ORF Transcript_24635/g.56964 Transcript_24635/m.56964 type:complete len:221 (+) Transcript_24635:91-753(+)